MEKQLSNPTNGLSIAFVDLSLNFTTSPRAYSFFGFLLVRFVAFETSVV